MTKEIKENNKKATKKTIATNVAKSTKTSATKTPATKTSATKKKSNFKMEYYDLPYSYNYTNIKLLAQTPKTLFVYWEIAQHDVINFTKNYGNDFFNETIPVLTVYNETKNYYFDVFINDYANSWYIPVPDEDCKYSVKLKRVFKEPSAERQFVEITDSNNIIIPNGHVISESMPRKVEYMNWKTSTKRVDTISAPRPSSFYSKVTKEYSLSDKPSSNTNNF